MAAGLLAAGALAGIVGVSLPGGQSLLDRERPVQIVNGYGEHRFKPILFDLRERALEIEVAVPPALRGQSRVSVQIGATDLTGASQSSNWNAGLPVPENPNYDAKRGVLTLLYDPSPAAESLQGGTDPGFDPDLWLRDLRVRVSSPVDATLQLKGARLVPSEGPGGVAEERPLLRPGARPPRPLEPEQLKHGVSQYFVYGDLHDFDRIKPEVERTFAAQQREGLDSFRWMGGLDVRRTAGGTRVGEREIEGMRQALDLAEKHGQRNFIFTLLDGAIPNQTLQEAMRKPTARAELVEALRPFVREFKDRSITWDLVNEIHGVADVTEAERQALVEDLAGMVSQEAPQATLTVGVQNYRELRHWSYLAEKFPETRFLYTFHLYEEVDALPDAWDLPLPSNAEVGITEADPARGMSRQIQAAARKGYSWMLFWEDASFDYTPQAHARALQDSFRAGR